MTLADIKFVVVPMELDEEFSTVIQACTARVLQIQDKLSKEDFQNLIEALSNVSSIFSKIHRVVIIFLNKKWHLLMAFIVHCTLQYY